MIVDISLFLYCRGKKMLLLLSKRGRKKSKNKCSFLMIYCKITGIYVTTKKEDFMMKKIVMIFVSLVISFNNVLHGAQSNDTQKAMDSARKNFAQLLEGGKLATLKPGERMVILPDKQYRKKLKCFQENGKTTISTEVINIDAPVLRFFQIPQKVLFVAKSEGDSQSCFFNNEDKIYGWPVQILVACNNNWLMGRIIATQECEIGDTNNEVFRIDYIYETPVWKWNATRLLVVGFLSLKIWAAYKKQW